jgi:hypothetical protein
MSVLNTIRRVMPWSRPEPAAFPSPALSKAAVPPKDPNMGGGAYGAVPVFDAGMKFADLGSTGLRAFSGWVREEFLPQLVGRQAARVYREMTDNSPTVGAILFAITGVMRKVEWRTRPANDTPQARELADFAESLHFDMSHSWEDFVTEWLSMLPYGFSAHEIVYKKRQGYQNSGAALPSSKFDDGRIGWRRLPIRAQDTVLKWFFGSNGEILGLTQQPWVGPLTDIPIEKMLLFRAAQHKNNPEGRSILRNAYLPYYYVKRLQEQEAILFERLSGLPVVTVPNALLEAASAGDTQAIAALNAYKKLVTNVRIDEQMGVLIPSDTYQTAAGASSIPMYGFKLETPNSGRSNLDADTPITRYKNDIMTSILADFLEMGHTARGAQSLAETKVDVFMASVEAWLNSGAAVLNRHGLPRLWELNGFDPALMPEYVPDMAQRIDLDGLGNFILRLSQAGMPLFPDPDLESYLRDTAGLPDIGENAGYAAAMTAAAGDDPETKLAKRADLKAAINVALARRLARSRRLQF